MRKTLLISTTLMLLANLLLGACSELPESVIWTPTITQRAEADADAKAAAKARESSPPTPPEADMPAEEEVPNTEEAAPAPTKEPTTWIPTSPAVGLFGGGVLFFCYDIEIQMYRQPSDELVRALAYPGQRDEVAVGLVTVAEVQFPAVNGAVTDLDNLADEVSAQEELCQPTAYGEVWDAEDLTDFTPSAEAYLTGIASLVDDAEDPYWIVRIGIVEEVSS